MDAAENDDYFQCYSHSAEQKYSNISCFWEKQPLGCLRISRAFHHSKPCYINGLVLPPDNNVSDCVPKTAADIEEERAIKEVCYISGEYYRIQYPHKHQSRKTASSCWKNELLPSEAAKRDLQKEYADDNALIPKNPSVIVRSVPSGGVKATSKPSVISGTGPVSGTSKATDDLAKANASEADKIKAAMIPLCCEYGPIKSMKKPLAAPPPSYICFRCGKPGHYIKHCPTNGDKNFKPVPRIQKSTGIPRSFMMEVKDPNTKGVMLQNNGKYAIPIINAEAYARGKKEKPPFLPEQLCSSSSSSEDPIPDELLCLICKEIMTDAAVIPCCGSSYCDECIRTALLESEEHTCPTCHQADVSPDTLIANQFLRKAVNNFKNGTGYTKRLRKQIQQQQQQPPPPPLMPVTPPGPFGGAHSVIPPAALLTGAEPPKSSSLSISSLLEEKACQVPVLRQPAFPTLLGPQGQSLSTTGHPMRASTPRSAGGRPGWELSESPYSASSYCSSYTYSTSRPRSSRSRSRSRSLSRSHSRPYSRSPPHSRKDKEKRQREVPAHDRKSYYGRSVDFRDPFENERHRLGPPRTRREKSPYARECREDYPGGQRHQSHTRAGNYPEKPSGRESHGIRDPTKSKEKDVENPVGDDKGYKHKNHSITFKLVSEKEKKEKDKLKAKTEKRKGETAVPPRKDNIIKPSKASQEKVDTDCEKSLRMEPPVKKVKKELPKTGSVKTSSS